MVEIQTQTMPPTTGGKLPDRTATNTNAPTSSISLHVHNAASRLRNQLVLDTYSPVNQNGSFDFDRVLKSGYLQKRTQKTKTWKSIYLVLRPNTLSIYKSDKEDKLRHKVYLADLTAVTLLKDPKNKRQNVFGLFSPARNFHFQAPTGKDAQEWVELIRKDARIEEEEEEMFLASPAVRRQSFFGFGMLGHRATSPNHGLDQRILTSSPEPADAPTLQPPSSSARRPSLNVDSGLSGNELASHSDFSDTDAPRIGSSAENLGVQSPLSNSLDAHPSLSLRNASQASGINLETDPNRVIWQGWLLWLRTKGGVKQWKNCWAVLRPRNMILYKDESEYSAQFIVDMPSVLNVVDIDPLSRTKVHCLQIITDVKSYRFCAHDEETLVQCLGAFKSLLAKRRELEAKAATGSGGGSAAAPAYPPPPPPLDCTPKTKPRYPFPFSSLAASLPTSRASCLLHRPATPDTRREEEGSPFAPFAAFFFFFFLAAMGVFPVLYIFSHSLHHHRLPRWREATRPLPFLGGA